MELPTVENIYVFDDLFFSFIRVNILSRKMPSSPFRLCNFKILYLSIICMVVHFASVLMGCVQLISSSNIPELSGAAAVAIALLICTLRGFFLIANHEVLNRTLAKFENIFPVSRDDQLKYVMFKYLKPLIFRNKALKFILTYGVITCYTLPLLQSSIVWIVLGREYPFLYTYVAWYPFDDKKCLTYLLAYFFQILSGVSAVRVVFYEELLFSMSVTQLSMHYEYLGRLMRELDAKNVLENFQYMKKIIIFQNTLMRLQTDVDLIFSLSTFISFTTVKISLCLFAFSLINGIDVFSMPLFAITVFAMTGTVYMRCSMGTQLYEASASLISSIYDSNWYEGNPRYRKILLIMLIKANMPVELHASSMNTISMEYFKELVVQTYEAFTFLRNFSV